MKRRSSKIKTRKARDIEKTYPLPEFIAKLRRLTNALEAAEPFTIAVAGERLRVPADAHCNIEHERESECEELEFQIRWKTRPARRSQSRRTSVATTTA